MIPRKPISSSRSSKSALPIDARLTKELQRLLATKSPEIPIPERCQMIDVLYLGDEGGVACCLDIGGPETTAAHIVSLTHLIFEPPFPRCSGTSTLTNAARIKKLKQQQSRCF